MRLFVTFVRFVVSFAVLLVAARGLHGVLPAAPHVIPIGPGRASAQLYGVVWWIALAFAVSALFSLVLALVRRVRGANGHGALRFTSDAATILIFALAAIAMSAFVFELPVSTVFATSSIIAVILGFALQNTVADLMSGFAMMIEQPFRIGDRIGFGRGLSGRVLEMNWRATHILAKTGDILIVPNGTLNRNQIVNHDARPAPTHRAFVIVKLENDLPAARATEILTTAASSANGVLANPEPRIDIVAFGDWAVEYKVFYHFFDWDEQDKIASNVLTAIATHLSWAGVKRPVPHTMLVDPAARDADANALPTLLTRVGIFRNLAADERLALADRLRMRELAKGAHLIEQDAAGDSLAIVREGIFEVRVRDANGADRAVARLAPGDYIGEASLLTGAPRNATIVALTKAVVYEINKEGFEPFLRARPEMAEALAAALVTRAADRDAALASNPAAVPRVLSLLADQIRAFFASHDETSTRIT
jgi:small-conductance mechanosensitive channel/CRP-like cAMP-binding protein